VLIHCDSIADITKIENR